MKNLKSVFLISFLFLFAFQIQSQNIIKKKISKKPAKFILGAVIGYNYVVGNANGDVSSFNYVKDGITGEMSLSTPDYGMQQGGGITFFGKQAINKKRNLYFIGDLGYNLFYNTKNGGTNRTKWNILDLGAGIELSHKSAPKNKVFVNLQLQYSLIFGSWQSNITYPDNTVSNIYVKIKPASRIGLSLGSGMEFKTGKKTFYVIGVKGVWANSIPKSSGYTSEYYLSDINDEGSGINLSSKKEIIYMQLYTGVNFSIK